MNKEVITNKQGVMLIILFMLGSTLVLGSGVQAGKNAWIAIILAVIAAIPLLLIYSRILSLFPGKDLFDIIILVCGKFIGKAICILFIWYAFHLASLVIRNFGKFIDIIGLQKTPEFVIILFITIICILQTKQGIEVLGRYAEVFALVIIIFTFINTSLSISIMNFDNILPVLYKGFKPVINAGFHTFSFPFAEILIFTMIPFSLDKGKPYHKMFLSGLFISALIVMIITIRNLLVLGDNAIASSYFPSYITVSKINIGNFLQRIEGSVAATFLIAGVVKISICLHGANNGIAKVFGLDDYKAIITPIGLLAANLSYIFYNNLLEFNEWSENTYPYYAFPFQVILPLIILIVAEIRIRSPKFQEKM